MDLRTSYMGIGLQHPVVASPSPLSMSLARIQELEDSGAAAVVMFSLLEEDRPGRHGDGELLRYGGDRYLESGRAPSHHVTDPESYFALVRTAKEAVGIPVIASLNGAWQVEAWVQHARRLEEAGADGLEINPYYLATDMWLAGAEIEHRLVEVTREVCRAVRIPVAVKLGSQFSALANVAARLVTVGARALVLFNRFCTPEIDLAARRVVPQVALSGEGALGVPVRWISLLFGRVPTDFALTGGVTGGAAAMKGILAGATVTMMASELLRHGTRRLSQTVEELSQWGERFGAASLEELRGTLSLAGRHERPASARSDYVASLRSAIEPGEETQ